MSDTRAADAAGQHADELARSALQWPRQSGKTAIRHLMRASGPDHWRAVEALIRALLAEHAQNGDECLTCVAWEADLDGPASPFKPWPCPTLDALRPLAEQVLRDLGDSHVG